MTASGGYRPNGRSRRWAAHGRRPPRWRVGAHIVAVMATVIGVLGIVGVAALATSAVSAPKASATTPGTPGTPQPPTTLYTENFENGVGATPELLTSYTGAQGETYTADQPWLEDCNGEVVEFDAPDSDGAQSDCTTGTATDFSQIRALAYALGELQSDSSPGTNHAVSAYTEGNPGANEVEFATVDPIPLPQQSGQFLTFSVDAAAENCAVSAPQYQFSLTNGSTSTPVGGVINACTSTQTENVPAVGTEPAQTIEAGSYTSNGSVLFTGSSVGISMTNANGSGDGNDAAFDDIEILDATPQLDKSFSPTSIYAGGVSKLTFTITNTSDLAAKDGWSFTDSLPSGLDVASNPDASTTCPAGTISAASGATTVGVTGGDLSAGEPSCTVTVDVTAPKAGTYTNGPGNVTETGLNPPGSATLTVGTQPTWACSAFGYLFQYPTGAAPTQVYQVNLASGAYSQTVSLDGEVNAVGYNPVDNYMYGMDNATGELVRIGSDGSLDEMGSPNGLPAAADYDTGDFNSSGDYFLANDPVGQNGTWYEIDLTSPSSPTYGQVIDRGTFPLPTGATELPSDWSYINGDFYGLENTATGDAHLDQFDPSTGTMTDLGPVTGVPGQDLYGATYASPGGYLWASNNVSGEIYRIDVNTKAAIAASQGPPSNKNDGARCASAGIPTITVEKTVGGRVQPSDQFTVGLQDSSGTALTSATTSGADTTVSTTNWPVTEGDTYTVTDAMASGAPDPLSDYTAKIVCTDTTTGAAVTVGGSTGAWTLPVTTTDNYTCDVTNTPAPVDLSVAKTSSPNPYTAGKTLTYTVTVKNGGPATAADATVSDPLPPALQGAGFTWTCAPSTGATCTASGSGNITDTVTIPAGGQVVYTETGTVPTGTTAELKNTATVTPNPNQSDPGCSPNCADTNYNPPLTVDLHVKKTADPDPYVPGDKLTYTVTVTNGGPNTATDATVSDPLPAALQGDGFTWTCAPSTGASCTKSGSGSITDTVTIPKGGQVVYTVTGTVPSSEQGKLSNTATVTPPPGYDDPGCSPSCSSNVNPSASPHVDLAVVKTSSPDPYVPGYELTYTITVTNGGPSDAVGAKVDDPLPTALQGAGFTWTCTASAGSTCTASGTGNVVDTVDVAAGGQLVYTVTGTVPKGTKGALDNTVTVTPPHSDVDPGCSPNCDGHNHNPQSDPQLSIHKVADASLGDAHPLVVGEKITYTYVVHNTGDVAMTHVGVSDPTLGAVTCPDSTLAVGQSETCQADKTHVVTQTDVDAGKVTDTATAHGDPPLGPKYTSPPSTIVIPSDPKPAVSLVKTATVSPAADQQAAKLGDTITYTFKVTNIGNVDLTSVHVNDPSGGAVSCPTPAAPGLAPGQSETCTGDTPHTVTQTDVDAGHVADTATATGTDANGQTSPPSDPSTATVPTAPNPAPSSPEQPLTHITTGHGLWGPGGPTGTLLGLVGGLLAAAGGVMLLSLRRRRRTLA